MPPNFARQFDAGAIAETKTPDVFVKLLFAEHDRHLGRADVARVDQDILHAQIAVAFRDRAAAGRRNSKRRFRRRSSSRA